MNMNYTDYIIKSIYVIVLSTALYIAAASIIESITPLINNLHQNKMEMLALQEKITQMGRSIKETADFTRTVKVEKVENDNSFSSFMSWLGSPKSYYVLIILRYALYILPSFISLSPKWAKIPVVGYVISLFGATNEEVVTQEALRTALTDIQNMKLQLMQAHAHFEQLRHANEVLGTAVTNLETVASSMNLNPNPQSSQNNFESALRELSTRPAFLGSGPSVPTYDSSHLFDD